MKDVRGDDLRVGDEVYIYWGYNELRPAIIKQISNNKVKVFCDGTLSKWKSGQCMIKASEPTGYYPDEVVLLIQQIIKCRDNSKSLEDKTKYQNLLNYWDKNRPMTLVTS